MIRTLRIKLVIASMLSLFLVLAVILGGVNLLNYRNICRSADQILAILAENNGSFPKEDPGRKDNMPPAEKPGRQDNPRQTAPDQLSPEAPYESRFFSVVLSGDGSVVATDTARIIAVDDTAAVQYAQTLQREGRDRGFTDSYRFLRHTEEQGERFIFLDCKRSLDTFSSFLWISLSISAAGLAAVLVLIVLCSGRIVKPVAESYEKQRRFITDAGHELKTPLTVIDADAEVLALEQGDSEWLRDIRRQTERLARLTGDLIFLSRMEEPESKPWIEFSLSDLVSETAASFKAPALAQGKTYTVSVTPLLPFCGDEESLRRLCSVLFDNAVKYCRPDGAVAITLRRDGKHLILQVQNDTDTVTAEELPHLFERFYRADSSRSSAGYGIGLSIARAVAEKHRGAIRASLPSPHSFCITVTLPV